MLDQLYHERHQIVTGDLTNLNVFAYNGRSSPKWKGQCRKNCGDRTHICMLSNSWCKKMKFGFIFENIESKIKTVFLIKHGYIIFFGGIEGHKKLSY